MKEAIIALWVSISLHKKLKDRANKEGKKLSELVEEIIINYLEKK